MKLKDHGILTSLSRASGMIAATAFTLSLCSIFILSIDSSRASTSPRLKVLVRENGKLVETTTEFKDLNGNFDGTYFKIVKGSTDAPITFDDDQETLLKAATVYFHLNLARDKLRELRFDQPDRDDPFYSAHVPDLLHLDRKVTVRIEQEQPFSQSIHFVTSGVSQYNSALTIPPSDWMRHDDTAPWGNEIWFFKGKKIRSQNRANMVAASLMDRNFKTSLLSALLTRDLIDLTRDSLDGEIWIEPHLMSIAVSFGLSELIPSALYLATKTWKQTYFLDTALIPEIIVHEYAHIPLAPYLGLKHATPLLEGIPNYLAAKIMGLEKLQAKAGKYSRTYSAKKGNSKSLYSYDAEYSESAPWGSYTFSLLMKLDENLGYDALAIIVDAAKRLDGSSRIRGDFELAVLQAIDHLHARGLLTKSATALKLAAQRTFEEKGL